MSVETVHETQEALHGAVLTPGHDPRTETPAFRHAREQLIVVLDKPCVICGIRHSQGGAMQAHHSPIERSYVDACDWRKVHRDFPQVVSQQTLLDFVDSAANLLILCAEHHIGWTGIHHVDHPSWIAQKYLLDGYELILGKGDNPTVIAQKDQQIEDAAMSAAQPPQE